MDETSLESLELALSASPENVALRKVLVDGWRVLGKAERATRLLAGIEPASVQDVDARLSFGRALAASGSLDRALAFVTGEDARLALERARLLFELGDVAEARASYEAAIRANATLEDELLSSKLRSREPAVVRALPGAPRLRVVSNDDTDDLAVSRLVEPESHPVTFDDVGGLGELKQEIHRRIVLPFQKPTLFERFRKRVGGGVLLYGPPGCGKTLIARATAGEVGAKFHAVAISDILDMYIGESERKLHAVFQLARSSTPSVLFFDELEALAGKRKNSRDGVAAKIVSQFLSELDGFARNNQGVLVLGATNVPWEIDAAFRRPGRFDRVLFVPPPDREARQSILEIHLRERPVESGLDVASIARRTSGFSGADLENLVETAADFAIADSLESGTERPIKAADLANALGMVKATTVEWLSSARNYARYANEGGQYDDVLAFLAKNGKS